MLAPVLQEFIEQNPDIDVYVVSRPFMQAIFKQFPQIKFIPVDIDKKYKGIFGLYQLYRELKQYNFDYVADLHSVIRSKIITKFFQFNKTKTATLDKGHKEKKALIREKNRVF